MNKQSNTMNYGQVLGNFVGTYVTRLHPRLNQGEFDGPEGAALHMEHLRRDFHCLGKSGRSQKAVKLYRTTARELFKFLDEYSAEEARRFFTDEGKRKTLLSKVRERVKQIDALMVKNGHKDYDERRKRFAKRIEKL